ncbi:MAG: EamA family transporter [Actinomycetales bacterium]|nr:MAG: EamA family transporter [Actinomycetales bacterium]
MSRSSPTTHAHRHTESLATALLVLLTAIWGSTFFLIHDLVTRVPPVDFLAARFVVAAGVAAGVFHRQLRALSRRDWALGALLGGLYGGAQILQTMGLVHTDASVSGFVTGTYVVLTPVFLSAVLRERLPASTWYAVLLATAGLAVLSLRGVAIGLGEALTLVAAALYAWHIIGLARWSSAERAIGIAAVQIIVIGAGCLVVASPGGLVLPEGPGQWVAVLYMAIVAGVGALWIQTWSQAHMTATRAAIVMTLEPVFAALFAVGFGGESVTVRMLLGGGLIVAAMYTVELAGGRAGAPGGPRHSRAEHLGHDESQL